jgi:hypothetical protein
MRKYAIPIFLLCLIPLLLMGASRVVSVPCGQNLATVVNNDPASTATRFQLQGCTYQVSTTIQPEHGDEIAGPVGSFAARGPAFDPENLTATIVGAPGLDQVMKPKGTFKGEWFRCEGGDFTGQAGSGVCYAGGASSSQSQLYAVRIADNEGAGVSNFHGTFWRSELTNNTTNPNALGFIGSGLKAVDEVWIVESFVHDTQGNGIWCDEECNDTNAEPGGRFVVNQNVIVGAGRDGIRWEKVGAEATSGEARIYGNWLSGNGRLKSRAGVGIRDARDAIVDNNSFGARTVAGTSYPKNYLAWSATDSGRSDRPNLANISIQGNARNGEAEKGCSEPDSVVLCANNTP